MPIEFRIDGPQGILRAHAEGVLTPVEIEEAMRRAFEHPEFVPGMRQLCDLRGLESVTGGYDDFQGLMRYSEKFADRLAGVRLALVGERDAIYGMLRMYQAAFHESPIEIQVFRDIDEAERWLGI